MPGLVHTWEAEQAYRSLRVLMQYDIGVALVKKGALVLHGPGGCLTCGHQAEGVPALQCSIDGLPLQGPINEIHQSTYSAIKSYAEVYAC